MRVVLILKPGQDLTQTKKWRPLNHMNCMGKLGEKVGAERIQEGGESGLHHQQFGSVRGCSTMDILYKSVTELRKCLERMVSV